MWSLNNKKSLKAYPHQATKLPKNPKGRKRQQFVAVFGNCVAWCGQAFTLPAPDIVARTVLRSSSITSICGGIHKNQRLDMLSRLLWICLTTVESCTTIMINQQIEVMELVL